MAAILKSILEPEALQSGSGVNVFYFGPANFRQIARRKVKGNHDKGQRAWEVLRGKSASERVSEREGFRGFQSF